MGIISLSTVSANGYKMKMYKPNRIGGCDAADIGGWTGWHEVKENHENEENIGVDDVGMEREVDDDDDVEEKEKDDTQPLMKLDGNNGEIEGNGEVEDISTWVKWSEEELSRDFHQRMPIRTKSEGYLKPASGVPPDHGCDFLVSSINCL